MPSFDASASPKPSAWISATLRAAHQLFDSPLILDDPCATRIVGAQQLAQIEADQQRQRDPLATAMRATMVVRARLAQDCLRQAAQRQVHQHVTLGSGLDTYALQPGHAPATRLFEVDLPAMLAWKRACMAATGIDHPAALVLVDSDFSDNSLLKDLEHAGFERSLPAAFSWLGVSMYLSQEQVLRLLQDVRQCAPGSSIVFDYRVPDQQLSADERHGLGLVAAALAAQGETLDSSFTAQQLEQLLRQLGFSSVEHYGPQELTQRYLHDRHDDLRLSGIFRMIHATV